MMAILLNCYVAIPHRKPNRLKNFDYSSSGWYFVTICTKDRQEYFGNIINDEMHLNEFGIIIENIWQSLSDRFPIELDEFKIMPNHVHMIIIIVGAHHDAPVLYKRAIHESPLQGLSVRKRSLLSQIIGYFKMNSAKFIHQINPNIPVWQRNYYDHIIRNEKSLVRIRQYIKNNPINWSKDRNNLKIKINK